MRRSLAVLVLILSFFPVAAWGGGTVSGIVTHQGPVPSAKRRPITTDSTVCGKQSVSEEFLVGKKDALKNAVVSIEGPGIGRKMETPEGGFTVDQKNCRFEPHVVVVPVGVPLTVRNSDPTLHNFHATSRTNPPQNKAQPQSVPEMTLQFDRPETFNVKCDVHPWMDLWVVVAASPYYALTGEDGRYRLKDVPAGDYNLVVWHEVLGTKARRVTVKEGEDLSFDVKFSGP